jgi:AraC-like DNA-binding protein
MIVLAGDIALQLAGRDFHLDLIRRTFSLETFTPITLVILGAAVHAQFYLSRLVLIEAALLRDEKIKEEMTLIALCNGLAVISGIFNLIGFFGKKPWGYLAAAVIVAVIHVGIFIEHGRSPQFFQIIKRRIREKHYRSTTLKGVNTETVLERLQYLFESEKIFTDYELTLQKLAVMLDLTPHQLSELINARLGLNFQNLVNRYRVAEAQRLIRDDRDRNILSICFRVGFSSKSAFNRAFKKQTGMGPADFKRR